MKYAVQLWNGTAFPPEPFKYKCDAQEFLVRSRITGSIIEIEEEDEK